MGGRASGAPAVGGECPDTAPIVAEGLSRTAHSVFAALCLYGRRRRATPGAGVGRVSEATFTFEYAPYTRRVRGVYLPVTLTAGDRTAHLVVRVDCASTYCVL